MSELKRYDFIRDGMSCNFDAREFSDGTFCLYSDHAALLAEKDKEIERVKELVVKSRVRTLFMEQENKRLIDIVKAAYEDIYPEWQELRAAKERLATVRLPDFESACKQALAATAQDITCDNAQIMVGNGETTNDDKPAQGDHVGEGIECEHCGSTVPLNAITRDPIGRKICTACSIKFNVSFNEEQPAQGGKGE